MCAGPPRLAGQRHQPPRAQQRAFLVAPFHVAAVRHAGVEHRLAGLQPVLVLAVVGDRPAAGPHHRLQAGIVLDQQVAGRAAGEHLDRAHAGQRFQPAEFRRVGLGGADIQPDVAPAVRLDIALLPGHPLGVGDGGAGVRHVEHGGQPAQHGRLGAGRDGLDRRVTRVAQMDVRVDQAGQHVQPGGVDHLVGGAGGADGGDAAVAHADIGRGLAPGQHRGAVADQQVEMGHLESPAGTRVFAHRGRAVQPSRPAALKRRCRSII